MLKNPTYTGRLVWNRLDFATRREAGGTARLRAEEEWVVSEVEHLPLVSDELFAAAQERFRERSRRQGARNGQAGYLFTGMPVLLGPPAARDVRAQAQGPHLHDL